LSTNYSLSRGHAGPTVFEIVLFDGPARFLLYLDSAYSKPTTKRHRTLPPTMPRPTADNHSYRMNIRKCNPWDMESLNRFRHVHTTLHNT